MGCRAGRAPREGGLWVEPGRARIVVLAEMKGKRVEGAKESREGWCGRGLRKWRWLIHASVLSFWKEGAVNRSLTLFLDMSKTGFSQNQGIF